MSHEKSVGEAGSKSSTGLKKTLLNLWPPLILSALYLLSPIVAGGDTYNLPFTGVLIGASLITVLKPVSWLKKIMQYAFIVGLVMGVVGVSPPIYFAMVYGLVSPVELALSIACVILTIIAIFKIKSLGML